MCVCACVRTYVNPQKTKEDVRSPQAGAPGGCEPCHVGDSGSLEEQVHTLDC